MRTGKAGERPRESFTGRPTPAPTPTQGVLGEAGAAPVGTEAPDADDQERRERDLVALCYSLRSTAGAFVLAIDAWEATGEPDPARPGPLADEVRQLIALVDGIGDRISSTGAGGGAGGEPVAGTGSRSPGPARGVDPCPLSGRLGHVRESGPVGCPLAALPPAARERAVRWIGAEGRARLGHDDVVVDTLAHVALVRGAPVTVPLQEFRLLELLAAREHRTVGTDELARHRRSVPMARTVVQSCIYRLRRAIEPEPRRPVHLVHVPGSGYRLDPCGRPVCERTA